jgi:predicted transcriptional regulator
LETTNRNLLKLDTRNTRKKFKADPEVLCRFADAFRDKTMLSKTQLHTYSKLRWNLHCKYLEWMTRKQYVREQILDDIKYYALTESGMKMFNITSIFLGCL